MIIEAFVKFLLKIKDDVMSKRLCDTLLFLILNQKTLEYFNQLVNNEFIDLKYKFKQSNRYKKERSYIIVQSLR
jgi:hypothetical protein